MLTTEYNLVLYTAVISGLLATCGFAARAAYDSIASVKETRRQRRLQHIEFLLGEFYIPITMRLHREQMIWDRIIHVRQNFGAPLGLHPGGEQLGDLDSTILDNHIAIQNIIISNIAKAAPQQHLYDALTKYDEHVTIYKALRDSGRHTCYPKQLGCPYPKHLYSMLMIRVRQLEKERDKILCICSCCHLGSCYAPEAVIAEPTSTEPDEEFEAIPRLEMTSQQEIHQLAYRSSTSDREACASNETEAV